MPYSNAFWACCTVATSVITGKSNSFWISLNHCKPFSPMPSKEFGRVLGFQIPALNKETVLAFLRESATVLNCSFYSALQGPAIKMGLANLFNSTFFKATV